MSYVQIDILNFESGSGRTLQFTVLDNLGGPYFSQIYLPKTISLLINQYNIEPNLYCNLKMDFIPRNNKLLVHGIMIAFRGAWYVILILFESSGLILVVEAFVWTVIIT